MARNQDRGLTTCEASASSLSDGEQHADGHSLVDAVQYTDDRKCLSDGFTRMHRRCCFVKDLIAALPNSTGIVAQLRRHPTAHHGEGDSLVHSLRLRRQCPLEYILDRIF